MTLVLIKEVGGLETLVVAVEGIVCVAGAYQHGIGIVLELPVDGAVLCAVIDKTVLCDEIPVLIVRIILGNLNTVNLAGIHPVVGVDMATVGQADIVVNRKQRFLNCACVVGGIFLCLAREHGIAADKLAGGSALRVKGIAVIPTDEAVTVVYDCLELEFLVGIVCSGYFLLSNEGAVNTVNIAVNNLDFLNAAADSVIALLIAEGGH